MNDIEKLRYQLEHRKLLPFARRAMAIKKLNEAKALLEQEIHIQAAYQQMDFGSLPMGHYRWAVKLLGIALESLELELDEHIWKIVHKEKISCYWNDKLECTNELYCDSCEHQPADADKPNGRKPPVDIRWQNDYGMMVPYCPVCGEMAYSTERCKFCGQSFNHDDAPPENKQERR